MDKVSAALKLVGDAFDEGEFADILRARSLLKCILHTISLDNNATADTALTEIVALLVNYCDKAEERDLLTAICNGIAGGERPRVVREIVYGVTKFLDDVEEVITRCDELLASEVEGTYSRGKRAKRISAIARERYCAVLPAGYRRMGDGEGLDVHDVIPDGRDVIAEPLATYTIYTLLLRSALN